eukprot:scaffold1954_cov268-Pinguiococcus_pyrenoidosus.AAC.281
MLLAPPSLHGRGWGRERLPHGPPQTDGARHRILDRAGRSQEVNEHHGQENRLRDDSAVPSAEAFFPELPAILALQRQNVEAHGKANLNEEDDGANKGAAAKEAEIGVHADALRVADVPICVLVSLRVHEVEWMDDAVQEVVLERMILPQRLEVSVGRMSQPVLPTQLAKLGRVELLEVARMILLQRIRNKKRRGRWVNRDPTDGGQQGNGDT